VTVATWTVHLTLDKTGMGQPLYRERGNPAERPVRKAMPPGGAGKWTGSQKKTKHPKRISAGQMQNLEPAGKPKVSGGKIRTTTL